MNHISDFVCNHQLFTIASQSNFFGITIFVYVALGIHFLIMLINLIPVRLSEDIILKKDTYVIASIIYIFLQTIVSYIISFTFLFFGWVGLALGIIYFLSFLVIAIVNDGQNDSVFVFKLGDYPLYLSEKIYYHKELSNKYKNFKQKNKEII